MRRFLADSAVWIDHIARPDPFMARALADGAVLCHPFVIGEVALGSLANRTRVLAQLAALRSVELASHDEVMVMTEAHPAYSRGVGYVDACLLAAARLNNVPLWTRDKRFAAVAEEMGLLFTPPR